MKILIVDDSAAKVADIVAAIQETSNVFEVESCGDCISAVNKLSEKFDLILLDLLLPLRSGDDPNDTGGKYIVNELYRNPRIKPPTYILCLTQHDNLVDDFHPIWRTIKYDPSIIAWKIALRELLIYISRRHSTDDRIIIDKTPTIYVEGKTDERILNDALKLFFPNFINRIRVKSDLSAGADWVTKQLVVWAYSLPKNTDGAPIKSAGIYDNDSKGNAAIKELQRTIKENSAQSLCIKAFTYNTKVAKHLIPIYKKGIQLPISLEEMFDVDHWEFAQKQNWLEERTDVDLLLKDPSNWNKRSMSLNDHIKSLGFTNSEILYLSKVCNERKQDFCNYILNQDSNFKRNALKAFQPLISNILSYIYPTSKVELPTHIN